MNIYSETAIKKLVFLYNTFYDNLLLDYNTTTIFTLLMY